MRDMSRSEYRALLVEMRRIKNPTREQMIAICPHLTPDQALDALTGSSSHYVALPPLKVRYSYRSASFFPGSSRGGRQLEPSLNSDGVCYRTARSYAPGNDHGGHEYQLAYAAEAMAYAEEHWGDELIIDDWTDFVQFSLQDPTLLRNDTFGGVITTRIIWVCLNRKWNDISNDRSRPRPNLLDDTITILTDDRLVADELLGNRGGYRIRNCARCGGGLDLDNCTGCHLTFPMDHMASGCDTPLAAKIVAFAREQGHEFTLDPVRLLIAG